MADLLVTPDFTKAFSLGTEAYSFYQSEGLGIHTVDRIFELGQQANALLREHKDELPKFATPPPTSESDAFEQLKSVCEQQTEGLKGVGGLGSLLQILQFLIPLILERFGDK